MEIRSSKPYMVTSFQWTLLKMRSHFHSVYSIGPGITHGVADSAPGDDVLGSTGILFESPPQASNRHIHGADITEVIISHTDCNRCSRVRTWLRLHVGHIRVSFKFHVGQIQRFLILGDEITP